MSIYLVAQVDIKDKERFLDYQNAVLPFLEEKQIEVLAVDDSPTTIEGEETGNRMVIVRYDNREAFDAFWQSAEYQEMAKIRFESADTTINLVQEENILIQ
ncbi:MAG: DUF1330 domain-containing protein [Planctomycetes bacterium]|jgi:uncharacterized protein (DUF1330 family)|nr:DUF1330 domain-containing protein [Planctomycetota bacterium]